MRRWLWSLLLITSNAAAQAPSFCGNAPAGWTGWINYGFTDSIPLNSTTASVPGPLSVSSRDTLNSAVRVTGLGAPKDTVWRLRWRTTVNVQTPPISWWSSNLSGQGVRSVYVCFRVRFNNWANANNVSQKFLFLRPADDTGGTATNNSVLNLYKFNNDSSDYRVVFDPNNWSVYGVGQNMDSVKLNATQPDNGAGWTGQGGKLTDGAAHVVEIAEYGNTGSAFNGALKVWVDGVPIASSTAMRYWLSTQSAQSRQFGYLQFQPIGGGIQPLSGAPNATMDLLYLYATSSTSGYSGGVGALDSTFRADTVTTSTISDSLIVRYLSTTFGKRTITYPDTIYVALHSRAPTRLGVGGILDTTWADTTGTGAGAAARRAKNILRIPNVGSWSSVVTSGTNRGCVTNQVKFGVGDTVKFFQRVWRWVSVWADSGLTKPMGVVKLALPVTARTGKQPSLLPGALSVCSGY